MKICSISALFPPYSHGGAENSAANLAGWYSRQGHQVHVLSAAPTLEDKQWSRSSDGGLTVWRRAFPRPYPVFEFPRAPAWKKPLWHLQDSFDPRNASIVGEFLDEVKPDAALIHYVPGIGYEALRELGRRNIPAVYYLHDLGLVCVKMSMFRKGKECTTQCRLCKAATTHRSSVVNSFERLGFCSPSRANLERVASFLDMSQRSTAVIPNARRYLPPTTLRSESQALRLMYVGRLHEQKGVEVALQAIARMQPADVAVRVVGGGQIEGRLRETYGSLGWCSFAGHIAPEAVANEMVNADVLLVPSVWLENLPGVVIQALGLGIPVIASDIGGIPELVEHERNGLLVAPGDVNAWHDAILRLQQDKALLNRLRQGALQDASKFDQDALGQRHFQFLQAVMAGQQVHVRS